MASAFAEFHDELRSVARDALGRAEPGATVDWAQVTSSGWTGLEVAEALDGAGAGFAELAVVLEEVGRAAAAGPFLGTAVLGVATLDLLEPGAGRDALLRGAAAGDTVLAVATHDGDVDALAGAPPFRLDRSSAGLRLDGRAAFVPDAAAAGTLLLVADDGTGRPVVVAGTAAETTGLTVTPQPVLDETRALGLVVADGVAVDDADVHAFAGDPVASYRRVLDRGAAALACDSLGLGEAMLEATVAYAKVREQFARPIGSFQAVKHACADMLVALAVSRELVAAAVDAVTGDDPEASVAASMAKAHVCAAAVTVVGAALQLHGGIGYTWESGLHVYLKRAALNRSLFGSPQAHRRRLAARYG